MSLIEQAAKRLEELRRAGAGAGEPQDSTVVPAAAERPVEVPTPEAAMRSDAVREAAGLRPAEGPRSHPRAEPPLEPPAPADATARSASARPSAEDAKDPAVSSGSTGAGAAVRTTGRRVDLNMSRLKEQGMITLDDPRTQIADEFRVIKRPIVRNALGRSGAAVKDGNLVMVTSALPGEGKTFTAINLALSVALEIDTTVLLIDGDVAHPDFKNRIGVPNSPGLLELLTRDDIDVADVLIRTSVDNLSIIPAGSHHRRATELLASEQMGILLRELASRYPDRIIIFDSPPLLATTEARVLASQMGQIVMVVAADQTRQSVVSSALQTIENCEVVLMVLNKAAKTDVGTYYGYYTDEAVAR
ncbi:MAG: XrtA-associated tyrosine autokinase [Burkholderiales bacterium]